MILIIQRLHRREQQNIPYRLVIRQQHYQAVDAVADASGGGHTDFEGVDEVFVYRVCFLVAEAAKLLLSFETAALIDRVVQLGIGVCHLAGGDEERTFYRLPMFKKIIIMLGGPLMNLVLAGVFFGIVLMGFGVQQYSTTLGSVSQCLIAASSEQTECTAADAPAPAAAAGLQPGDRIVSIAGTEITEWQQIGEVVSAAPGQPLVLEYERDAEVAPVTLTPAMTERWLLTDQGEVALDEAGEPLTQTVGMIGVTPTVETVTQPITAVPQFVGNQVVAVSEVVIGLPQRMVDVWQAAFGNEDRDPNGPIGVVGVGRLAGEIVSYDEAPVAARAQFVISLLGSLNIALVVFNLIPLMPLDGGHIAGAIYEGIKRGLARLFRRPDPGPVDTAKMVPVTFAVVIVLGAMSLLLLYADIVKPVTLFG